MNPTYGVQMQMIYSLKRALLALFVLWPLASAAAVTELDRVVAIVEDDVVLDSELKERLVRPQKPVRHLRCDSAA